MKRADVERRADDAGGDEAEVRGALGQLALEERRDLGASGAAEALGDVREGAVGGVGVAAGAGRLVDEVAERRVAEGEDGAVLGAVRDLVLRREGEGAARKAV